MRQKYTPERVSEIVTWQRENKATDKEAAQHFKLTSGGAWAAARKHYAGTKRKFKKPKLGATAYKPRKQYTKQPKFVDLEPIATVAAQVAVIVCTPEQVGAVIRGLQ